MNAELAKILEEQLFIPREAIDKFLPKDRPVHPEELVEFADEFDWFGRVITVSPMVTMPDGTVKHIWDFEKCKLRVQSFLSNCTLAILIYKDHLVGWDNSTHSIANVDFNGLDTVITLSD